MENHGICFRKSVVNPVIWRVGKHYMHNAKCTSNSKGSTINRLGGRGNVLSPVCLCVCVRLPVFIYVKAIQNKLCGLSHLTRSFL